VQKPETKAVLKVHSVGMQIRAVVLRRRRG